MTTTGAGAHAANKRAVASNLRGFFTEPLTDLGDLAAVTYTEDALLHAFHPVNDVAGRAAIVDALWRPLRVAFPDIERRDQIVAAACVDSC